MAEKKEKAPVFAKADLIKAAPTVFGVTPEVMAGALHNVEEATEAQAKELLNKFKTREVKN